jgi:hypothetical protein
MNELAKEKSIAFLVHFIVSLLIIGIFVGVVLLSWYPYPFSRIESVWDILRVIILVDVVLGPLITLIIYKKDKPSLKFDLSLIAAVQIVALSWGAYVTFQQRPVYLVLYTDFFSVVPATDADMDYVSSNKLPVPAQVYLKLPDNKADADKIRMKEYAQGTIQSNRSDLYRPIEQAIQHIAINSVNISQRISKFPDLQAPVDTFLSKQKASVSDFFYMPIDGRRKLHMAAFDKTTGNLIGLIY